MGTNIFRMAKLDFALLKTYKVTVWFIILIPPMIYTLVQHTLTGGISFAMCAAAMTSSYVFSIEEKNSMERLYGILPVNKKEMVLGRYCFIMALGLGTLIISFLFQSAVLLVSGRKFEKTDFLTALFLGVLLFVFSSAFQLPGYYKFGSIKGRFFVYLPLAGFLLVSFGLDKLMGNMADIAISLPLIAVVTAALVIGAYVISIWISVGIVKKKEV